MKWQDVSNFWLRRICIFSDSS